MAECTAKHTKYQPTREEWRCPRCGSTHKDGFYLDESADGANEDCELLHEDDSLRCYVDNCRHELSGKAFAARLQRKHNLVPCPHCKGKGLVPSPAEKEPKTP